MADLLTIARDEATTAAMLLGRHQQAEGHSDIVWCDHCVILARHVARTAAQVTELTPPPAPEPEGLFDA